MILKKLIIDNYFYIDKSLLIKELIHFKGETNLFIRSRRFGKTLNMGMLQYLLKNDALSEKDKELREMMAYYGHENRFSDRKRWYDGYNFGGTDIYNPWSVIKFMFDLNADNAAFPRPYWINTSSNEIIKDMALR